MRQQTISGVNFIELPRDQQEQAFSRAVGEGLSKSQKALPYRFFYDSVGSQLFEQISRLPEYYLTRTERKILDDRADEIIDSVNDDVALVEFGSGSSIKTRILINAIFDRQKCLHYIPIDISFDFLKTSSVSILHEYRGLSVTAIAAKYDDAIQVLPRHDGPRLILFLGSSIGNFDQGEAIAFMERIRHQMTPQDRILVGFDLLKDRHIIEAAYNDTAGVTATFNKNLLVRINRELGGTFILDQFKHAAPFVEEQSRIEMYLISRCRQTASIGSLEREFSFEPDEYIHTENSHKYTFEHFAAVCDAAGLEIQARWTDEHAWFAVVLLGKQKFLMDT